jgi:hypothetical protein
MITAYLKRIVKQTSQVHSSSLANTTNIIANAFSNAWHFDESASTGTFLFRYRASSLVR